MKISLLPVAALLGVTAAAALGDCPCGINIVTETCRKYGYDTPATCCPHRAELKPEVSRNCVPLSVVMYG